MFWQHFWGGSVAVLDSDLLMGLGLRVLGLRVEDVNLGMRVLVWYHFLFGSTITIHTNSNIKGRRVSSSLPISMVCLHLFFIFCLSPTFSSFFVCLHLNPHFLSVSISIFIFYLSPSLYGDRQKMRIKMETDRKLRQRWRETDDKDKDGDRQKMRIEIETDKKWG